jgi:hypothetical protein
MTLDGLFQQGVAQEARLVTFCESQFEFDFFGHGYS